MPNKPTGNSALVNYLRQLHEYIEAITPKTGSVTTRGTIQKSVASVSNSSSPGNDKPVWL